MHVAVNFQGGWCEGAIRFEKREVVVSGVTGEETICYPDDWLTCTPDPACRQDPIFIGLLFRNANGRLNYVVHGDARDDVATVRRIIESFRFLDD